MAETKKLRSEVHDLKETISELKGNIKELKEIMTEKNVQIENSRLEINLIKETYHNDLECIKNILAEQTALINNMNENLYPLPKYVSRFPIKTQEDLDVVETYISDENRQHMVSTVLHLIRNGGFKANILSVLGEKIILDHNVDGRQGKRPLTHYAKLMSVFFEAAQKLGVSEGECTKDLRYAMKSVKNRFHKASCLKRKLPEATPENN